MHTDYGISACEFASSTVLLSTKRRGFLFASSHFSVYHRAEAYHGSRSIATKKAPSAESVGKNTPLEGIRTLQTILYALKGRPGFCTESFLNPADTGLHPLQAARRRQTHTPGRHRAANRKQEPSESLFYTAENHKPMSCHGA